MSFRVKNVYNNICDAYGQTIQKMCNTFDHPDTLRIIMCFQYATNGIVWVGSVK